MKKFGKLKLFGLLIFLSVALVFIGINYLEGTKPDKPPGKPDKPGKEPEPEYTWNVTIPGKDVTIPGIDVTSETVYYNLYGLPDEDADNTYLDEDDRVHVIVEKKKGGKEYLLRLFIYHSAYEGVCEELPYPHQIGFQDVQLVNVPHSSEGYWVVPEEFPCFFPNYRDYTGECYPEEFQSEDWWRDTGRVPGCMKHFLENYDHPICDMNCNIYENTEEPSCETICPNCIYRNIDIRITVDHNIEKMQVDEEADPTALVRVEVENNYDLQTGQEDWHNISGLLRWDDSVGCVTITRKDTNTWEITVDTGEYPLFTFIEIYKGGWNNRWEYKIPYWTEAPFKFMTTWTRQEVK